MERDDRLSNFFEACKVREYGDDPFCQQYVESLSSFGVSKLLHEPEHLKENQECLMQQTQALAFENYRTFIQAAECSREIYRDFNVIGDHLDSLVGGLPEFTSKIEDFNHSSLEINASRKQNSMVLLRHTQLLEILEISQLMDTCVRNGYYEEALQLSNYVKRIEKKLGSIQVIVDISKDVKRSTQLMLSQLLQQLQGQIQLPACLRIISYLRQLEVFSEPELRIRFLQARDMWFQSVLVQIPNNDAYSKITKVIELSRVTLFDIVTQYRAIFSDDEPVMGEEQQSLTFSNILHAWISRKISEFITTLQQNLPSCVKGRVDSLFAQCMYFGLSFSRIGADFRGIISSHFHRIMLGEFKDIIKNATELFEEEVSTLNIGQRKVKAGSFHQGSLKDIMSVEVATPPAAILEYNALAVYTNGILSAFNMIRQYPALPLALQITSLLQGSLQRVISGIQSWAKLECQAQLSKKSAEVERFCSVILLYFLPYINNVLQSLFNPTSISEIMDKDAVQTGSVSHQTEAIYLKMDILCKILCEYAEYEVYECVVNAFQKNSRGISKPSIEEEDSAKFTVSSEDSVDATNLIGTNNSTLPS